MDFEALQPPVRLPPVEFRVTGDVARAYLQATGAALLPEAPAPPLALVALALAAMTERMPLPPSTLHVGQEVSFFAPVPLDATVRATFRLDARRGTGTHLLSSFHFELYVGERSHAAGRIQLRHRPGAPAVPAAASG